MKSIAMTPANTQNVFAIKAALLAELIGAAVAVKYLEARRVPQADVQRIMASVPNAK